MLKMRYFYLLLSMNALSTEIIKAAAASSAPAEEPEFNEAANDARINKLIELIKANAARSAHAQEPEFNEDPNIARINTLIEIINASAAPSAHAQEPRLNKAENDALIDKLTEKIDELKRNSDENAARIALIKNDPNPSPRKREELRRLDINALTHWVEKDLIEKALKQCLITEIIHMKKS